MAVLDWVFLAVLVASLLVGAWRGLVYEVFSVVSWIAAFVLAHGYDHGWTTNMPLDEFLAEAAEDVAAALTRLKGGQRHDREAISEAARLAARRAAQRWSGKKPQVRVILMEH